MYVMRKILFAFLRLWGVWRKFKLRLTGKSEARVNEQRVVSGRAWDEFCDQLKLAGNVLHGPGTPGDPFQQSEGIRYLTRLIRAGLEAYIEYADPAYPVLRSMAHETVKMGADNPDNFYQNAQISGDYEYIITGKRNSVDYLGFFTRNGNYGTTGGLAPCGKLESKDLVLDEDGSFEIILSKEPRGRNWLKIEKETSLLIVRQTFFDRSSEVVANMQIKNLDGRSAPDPVSPQHIDEGLKMVSMFVAGVSWLFTSWSKDFRKHTNQLPMFDPGTSNAAGGDPGIIYYHSHWKLEEDQMLVIEVKPPDCENWNFQLNNYWMESLDYRYHRISINKGSAVYDKNGGVRVVVAREDPGLDNWLETAGHNEGTMCWRWYRLKDGEKPVDPHCSVVHIKEFSGK
jgi:hypothetical protein